MRTLGRLNQIIGLGIRRNNIVYAMFPVLCFVLGVAFHKYVHVSGYLRVSDAVAFIRSPAAYVRGSRRDWKSIELQQYTQDHGGVGLRRYLSTGLLPIVVDGK